MRYMIYLFIVYQFRLASDFLCHMIPRLFRFILCATGSVFRPASHIQSISNKILILLGVRLEIKGLENWYEFQKEYRTGIIAYTHHTFYDHCILYAALGSNITFVAFKKYFNSPLLLALAKRYKLTLLDDKKGSGGFQVMEEAVRGLPEGLYCAISPEGGNTPEKQEDGHGEFRNGAFGLGLPILPVVIRFDPYVPWMKGVSFQKAVCDHFAMKHETVCSVTILPVVYRDDSKNYIKSEMDSVLVSTP